MKAVFVAAFCVLAVAITLVHAEQCSTTQDCSNHHITSCGGHTHVVCDGGNCHCLQQDVTGPACKSVGDCGNLPLCHGNPVHCVDNVCRCRRH